MPERLNTSNHTLLKLLALFGVIGVILLLDVDTFGWFGDLVFAIVWVGLLFWTLGSALFDDRRSLRRRYEKELQEAQAWNKTVDDGAAAREQERSRALNQRDVTVHFCEAELKKAEQLLDEYYAMNVLPNPYRSIVPVCYIYDYMSSSQATLEDTLMHEHMENGFQRLEAKLDQVVSAVCRLITETRCMRAENRAFAQAQARRDQQMLSSLQRVEASALEAAHYAELIDCNARATAYFELANYLREE